MGQLEDLQRFLSAFYKPHEEIHIRTFHDREKQQPKNYSFKFNELEATYKELKAVNDEKHGVFFVVNAGGHNDKSIDRITAQFYECDAKSFEDQWKQINAFPLLPSIVVKTSKSLHVYYLMRDGAEKDKWRSVQKQLVAKFDGDPQCINESRVLRIPGFYHNKKEPVMVECPVFEPHRRYDQKVLSDLLPVLEDDAVVAAGESTSILHPGIEVMCDKCLFMKWCKENPEEVSEHDWLAMISNMATFKGGVAKIHEYSSPYTGYSVKETDQKIQHVLDSKTGPIMCSTIAEKGWICPNIGKCNTNSPAGLAFKGLTVDELQSYIERIPQDDSELRNYLKAKNYVENYFAGVSGDIAISFIQEFVKEYFGLTVVHTKALVKFYKTKINPEKIRETMVNNYALPLKEICSMIVSNTKSDTRTPTLCQTVYEWLKANKAVFYKYPDGKCCMFYRNRFLQLSDNPKLRGFVYNETGILSSGMDGRAIMQALADKTEYEGKAISSAKWMYYDPIKDIHYYNLCDEENSILKLSSGVVDIVSNGVNEDSIMLEKPSTPDMVPIKFLPDVDICKGLLELKTLIMDNLTIEREHALFIFCYIIAIFLKDRVETKPIIKFSGSTAAGKSTAAKLITTLLYGSPVLNSEAGTGAGRYTAASRDPLFVMDNLEADNMNQGVRDFLLTAVSGVTKTKREMGTDTGLITEKIEALIMITGIEPLAGEEVINRTFEFRCSNEYKQSCFLEQKLQNDIKRARNRLLSAIFRFIAEILLPDLNDLYQDAHTLLSKTPHKKERSNEMIANIMSILAKLDELSPEFLNGKSIADTVSEWLSYHDRTALEIEEDTDSGLLFLEVILKDLQEENNEIDSVLYRVPVVREKGSVVGWLARPKDLYTMCAMLAKNKGFKFEYRNARQLFLRVKNNTRITGEMGWEIKKAKRIGGYDYYRFIKKGGQEEDDDS